MNHFFSFLCLGCVVVVSENFNNSGNVSNWELGRIFVREGKFDDAHRCFLAEVTLSDSANTFVYNDHGHLLNMMGRYDDAIVKFDSYLSSHPDYASSLFGKGISFIGLNRLDEALYWFDKALKSDCEHADAWYYSAIIYANPFFHKSNIGIAKEYYKNYLDSRENYINNPKYFNELLYNLPLEEVHDYYNVSDLFRLIDQLLNNGNIEDLFIEEVDGEEGDDSYRLFDDVSLVEKIDKFNSKKNIEVKFESAGFSDCLIKDLSSHFGGLSIEDKIVLVDLMDYFKGFRLSLTDINDLIRENVIEDEMSLDSVNENRENIANDRIEENDEKLLNSIKEEVLNSVREDFNIRNAENKQLRDENNELKNKNESLTNENESLSKENESLSEDYKKLKKDIQKQKGVSKKQNNQPNMISENNKLIKDMSSSIENLCNELIKQTESCLRDEYENASSENRLSGLKNIDYKQDLKEMMMKRFAEKYDISEKDMEKHKDVLKKLKDPDTTGMAKDNAQADLKKLEEKYVISEEDMEFWRRLEITSISEEDFKEVLKVLESEYGISKEIFDTFDSAFKNFEEGNFEISSDLFGDTNLIEAFHSDELQIYREFLEVTSLSREGKVKDAYKMIELEIKNNKRIDKSLKIEKNPIRWFNFGNICFDYANSQSDMGSNKAYDLAYSCYSYAIESFKLNNFKFSKDEEKKFKKNVLRMASTKKIYGHLAFLKEFKKENLEKEILENLSSLRDRQVEILHDLNAINKN